jgi:hypothetical protein
MKQENKLIASTTYKRCPAVIMEGIIKTLIQSITNYKIGEYTWKDLSRNVKVIIIRNFLKRSFLMTISLS